MKKFLVLVLILFALVFAQSSHAELTAVGAVDPATSYPFWYQDSAGLALSLCLDNNGFCILPGAEPPTYDPTLPPSFPDPVNMPSETFYFLAETTAGACFYRSALEQAWASATGFPQAGQQIVFARIRIRCDIGIAGTYTVTHPYGSNTFNVTTAGVKAINFTEDIGFVPLDFAAALGGAIGPFLTQASGATVTDPLTGEIYLANPGSAVAVTGSPTGNNFFRVSGPDGTFTSNTFFLMGKKINMQVSPASIVFAKQGVAPLFTDSLVTVKNLSTTTALNLGAITSSSADFTIIADTCSNSPIAASGQCTFTVRFSGTAGTAERSAEVLVPSTDVAIPAAHLLVSGTIDSIAPTVAAVFPENGSPAPANVTMTAVFSEAMAQATMTTTNFTVTPAAGAPIAGTVTYDTVNNTATFTPSALLTPGVVYTAAITTGATDAVGNALAATSWTFTGAAPDSTPPTISSTNPANNGTGFAISSAITVVFSEQMHAATINASNIKVSSASGAVAGTVTYDSATKTATFTPNNTLASGTPYTITVMTAVDDLARNTMGATFTATFVTNFTPTAPEIVSPANGATGIASPVTLKWTKSNDQDSDTVSYKVSVCNNPFFIGSGNNCQKDLVVTASADKMNVYYAGLGGLSMIGLIGLAFAGGMNRRSRTIAVLALVLITGMSLYACGGGGGGGGGGSQSASTDVTTQVSNLSSGVTYFWKVTADDGKGGSVVTEASTFTTQ